MIRPSKPREIDRMDIRSESIDLKFLGRIEKIRPNHLRDERKEGQLTVFEKCDEDEDQ